MELNFNAEQLHILSCFLAPDEMQEHRETPLPVDSNEEIFEYVDGEIRPKVRNVRESEMIDPIYNFFYPKDEKEGK